MREKILKKIKYLSEDLPKKPEAIRYTDKPFFNDLKRVLRVAKKTANKEKQRKIGYFLQEAKKSSGSDKNKEEIIRKIFANKQSMSTNEFIDKIYDYASKEFPKGELAKVSPEDAFQTTQRMIPSEKINKTLSVSLFGEILEKPLKKFLEEHPDFDELYRGVHKHISQGHFNDSAAFVRYSLMTKDWIHFDSFQTDYFNKLRKIMYGGGNDKLVDKFMKELEAKENDFFKTAVSYIVRVNPSVKVFTANTPEIAQRVENMKGGSLKLVKLYHKLPKALGFKLITIDKLFQIFDTRPGESSEVKKKLIKKGLKVESVKVSDALIKKVLSKLHSELSNKIKEKKELNKAGLDALVSSVVEDSINHDQEEKGQLIIDAIHQFIENILVAYNKGEKSIKDFFEDKKLLKKVKEQIDKKVGVKDTSKEIWWANKQTIFEDTEKDYILRMIE